MYNKTATAVVLALLGVANAAAPPTGAIDPQPTKENFATTAMIRSYGCTAGGEDGGTDLADKNDDGVQDTDSLFADAMKLQDVPDAELQWACYSDAAAHSLADTKKTGTKDVTNPDTGAITKEDVFENKNVKFCVEFTPGTTAWDGTKEDASCYLHTGWGLTCNQNDVPKAQSVYMRAGLYQKDAAVREAACYSDPAQGKQVERWCRCANWRYNGAWAPEQEDYKSGVKQSSDPATGVLLWKKDAQGNDELDAQNQKIPINEDVMSKRNKVMKDSDGLVIKDVNQEDKLNWVYTEANCFYGYEEDAAGNPKLDANGNPIKLPIPAYETNWEQLPAQPKADAAKQWGVKWLAKCPTNWEVPADKGVSAARGSYKGYTNRYTFSKIGDDKHEEGNIVTWDNESEGYGEWSDVAKVGAIAGFGVFGLGILLVITAIAIDMRRRMAMYEELIAEDLDKINQMGLGGKMGEFEKELAVRLAGGLAETGVDDQLVTQALELRPEDFSKHM